MSADASSNWQASICGQVKQGAAYVEDIRYLYTVEAPQAVLTAEAQARAQELARAAQSQSDVRSGRETWARRVVGDRM